jgi:two-component system, OmpR family, sensor kinase
MTMDERRTRGAGRKALTGIRVRVVAGYVALLAVALVTGLLITRQLLVSRLESQVEDDLAQEVEEFRRLATGNNPSTGEPFGSDAAAIFDTFLARNVPFDGEAFFTVVDGRPYRYSAEAPAQLLGDTELVARWNTLVEPQHMTANSPAGEARTLAVPLRDGDRTAGVFVVAVFPQEARDELSEALRLTAAASGVVLVLSAVVAWSLAGRVLRPVRDLTATAHRITDSDLSARIPVEGHDELAELGHTFNEMLDRVQHAVEEQRQFLDDVAHELRTPLTIARGHLEVAGNDPAERAATVALVTDELDRMGRYVDDLLLLAKAETGPFLRVAPADVGELAEGLLRRVEPLGDRQWSLVEAPTPGRVAAVVDAGRLEQAMLNLATNAVQHTRDGEAIELGASAREDEIALWVRDHGPGLDPAARDTVFDRSTRGAASRVARPDGTGLGLTIVSAIARAHGGRVDASDTPGGGSTFTITVPLEHDAEEDRL